MRSIVLLSYLLVVTGNALNLKIGSYGVSERAPLAAILQRNITANNAIDTLLWHFNQVDKASSYSSCEKSLLINTLFTDLRVRWPEHSKDPAGCIGEINLKNHGTKVWHAMNAVLHTLDDSASEILKYTKVGWNNLYARDAFQRFADESCSIQQAIGIRVRSVWYVRLRVTATAPEDITSPNRIYLTEYVTRDKSTGNLISVGRPVNDTNGKVMRRATTVLTIRRSRGRIFNVAQGPAGRQRLFDFRRWNYYATETLLTSNVGALVLPLMLALLPLPLFSETDTLVLILYSLLTDVCNSLPLLFKGYELLSFAFNPPLSASASYIGLDVPNRIGGIRTWVMGCNTDRDLKLIGVWFIIVSVFAMVLGICLEVYTYRKLIYIKHKRELDDAATSNSALVHLWALEKRCSKCSCYGDIYHEGALLHWSRRKLERRISMIRYIPGVHSLIHHGADKW